MRLRKISNGVTIYDEEVSMEKAASKFLLYLYRYAVMVAIDCDNWLNVCDSNDEEIIFSYKNEQRILSQFSSQDENSFLMLLYQRFTIMTMMMLRSATNEYEVKVTLFRISLSILLYSVLKMNAESVASIINQHTQSPNEKIFSLVLDEQYRNNIERLCVNPELN